MHKAFLVLVLALTACSGGGGSGVMPQAALGQPTYAASLRNSPSVLTLSLGSPGMQFLYVDPVSVNGVYPDAQSFFAEFQVSNPTLLSGSCSNIAIMSAALISPNAYSGQTSPTVVISFYPKAVGSCSQSVNGGQDGTRSFTITVTP